jgi:hypothetical protein
MMPNAKPIQHFFIFLCSLFFIYTNGQLNLTSTGVDFSIGFDQTVLEVNEAEFAGSGFHPLPVNGQLDSDAWSVEGLSEGDLAFGNIGISGDFARGFSTGGVTHGGIYSFEVDTDNRAMGFQPSSSEFSPGSITLKVINSSGFLIERLKLSYLLWVYNDQNRSSRIELSLSNDDITYSTVPGSAYASVAIQDLSPNWQSIPFNFTIENLNVLPETFIYIKWNIADESGSGSRDEFGIDDITLRISNSLCIAEAFYLDELGILQSTEGLILNGIAGSYETPGNFGEASPGARLDVDGAFIETSNLTNPNAMQFRIKGQGNTSGSSFLVEGFNGATWNQIALISALPSTGTIYQYQNLSNFERFKFTYNKNLGNLSFDDLKIFCGDCNVAAKPANSPDNVQLLENLCNRATINWLPGDADYFLVLVSNAGTIDFIPNDNTTYLNNRFYGEGQEVFPDEFIAYSGSETTVTLSGLATNTTYNIEIFGYNGLGCEENYLTTNFATFDFITPDCNQCPYLTSALINPCTGGGLCNGNEGFNEMLFMNAGGIDINTISPTFAMNYISGNTKLLNEIIVSNSVITSNLNTISGCNNIFIDGSNTIIPAGSKIVFVNESICTDDIDFSGLCNGETIYVIYANSSQWSASGVFANSGQEMRRFEIDFRNTEIGCLLDYAYVPNNIPQADGAVVAFGQTGGIPTGYQTLQNCELLFELLPVTLGEFYAVSKEKSIQLYWKTFSEVGNAGFEIEKKIDDKNSLTLGWIDGHGTTAFANEYKFIDEFPANGLNFYRLKQTDWDGNFEYSDWVVANYSGNTISIFLNAYKNLEIISFESDVLIFLDIIGINGNKIKSYKIQLNNAGSSSINLPFLAKGIYLAHYKSQGFQKMVKFFY